LDLEPYLDAARLGGSEDAPQRLDAIEDTFCLRVTER
jgi:hypothetical protein